MKQFLLVEPVAKTPYPPLGLLKISSMLKTKYPGCTVFSQVGKETPENLVHPESIYVTSLFTWDFDKLVAVTNYLKWKHPQSEINIGGIAASLLPEETLAKTGISPHIGLHEEAECCVPDYSLNFDRKVRSSISFTTRGCIRKCKFCTVTTLEPDFYIKNDWENDIAHDLPTITFWDNNWLASPNVLNDCKKLSKIGKKIDFNQGLDARLYTKKIATALSKVNIDPLRFAFDDISQEKAIVSAIRLAKKMTNKEIAVYVLYNFKDTPEEFYYKINLLNQEQVLSFPMCYREPSSVNKIFPNEFWNSYILRGLKLSLLFYYRRGMITESRRSFENIYGHSYNDFITKLYDIYEYDKNLKKKVSDNVN